MRIEDQTKYYNLIRDLEHIRLYLQALNKAYIVYIKPLEEVIEILRKLDNRTMEIDEIITEYFNSVNEIIENTRVAHMRKESKSSSKKTEREEQI
jgi:hypothetical protein